MLKKLTNSSRFVRLSDILRRRNNVWLSSRVHWYSRTGYGSHSMIKNEFRVSSRRCHGQNTSIKRPQAVKPINRQPSWQVHQSTPNLLIYSTSPIVYEIFHQHEIMKHNINYQFSRARIYLSAHSAHLQGFQVKRCLSQKARLDEKCSIENRNYLAFHLPSY